MGLTSGFVPYLPLPAQTTVCFGKPIRWPGLRPRDADDPEVLERCYREVESLLQRMLDRLMAGRRFLLGKRQAHRSRVRAGPAPETAPAGPGGLS